jgi:signal transduction histidine kinase
VPLLADHRALGVLVVLGKGGGFTQDDEDILALFASSAAVALSNSMLFEKTLELERLKSDFVAVVSHELRTPLAVVIGNLELLSDDRFWKLEEQQAKFLTATSTNSHRLLHLINDILDLSKLENASLPMTRSPNELGEVIRQAAENLRRLFEEREINLDIAIAEDLPLAEIDEQRIAQVLTNLISNAIKFSPAGAPVEVSVTHDGEFATVRVRDRGEGIRREDMPKLFKKFSQLDSKSTRKAGGTGLGLAISRGLIEAHGGAIWAERSRAGLDVRSRCRSCPRPTTLAPPEGLAMTERTASGRTRRKKTARARRRARAKPRPQSQHSAPPVWAFAMLMVSVAPAAAAVFTHHLWGCVSKIVYTRILGCPSRGAPCNFTTYAIAGPGPGAWRPSTIFETQPGVD